VTSGGDDKIKHRKPVIVDEAEPSGGAKVISLVEALKRSVASRAAVRHPRMAGDERRGER
jgi:non-homologous end joining protein Ku